MTVCTRAWELTWQRPTIPIRASDNSNHGDAEKAMTISPYNATPPSIRAPLGSRSPTAAMRTALHSAPTPMAVRSSPWPLAPTPRRSRAKTGRSVVKGMMNRDANIAISRPVRTTSFLQLNFHPSTMLRPKDSPCAG